MPPGIMGALILSHEEGRFSSVGEAHAYLSRSLRVGPVSKVLLPFLSQGYGGYPSDPGQQAPQGRFTCFYGQ